MSIFKCFGGPNLSIVTFLKPSRPHAEVLLYVTKGALQSEVRIVTDRYALLLGLLSGFLTLILSNWIETSTGCCPIGNRV
jgi:hypothetical protein